jgi:trimeric autotransporter adhesin
LHWRVTHQQEDQALPNIRAEEAGTTDTAAAAAVHRAAAEAEARGFAGHITSTTATAGDADAADADSYNTEPAAHNAPPTASQEARGSVILQPEEDSDVSDDGESHEQGGDAPGTPRRRSSRKALSTRNAELQYQNALLRAELMRLQEAARRAGRPPLPPQSPSSSSGGAGTPRSSTRRKDFRSAATAASPSRAVAESGTQAAVVTSDAAVGTSSDSAGTAAVAVPDDSAAATAVASRAKEEEYEALRSGLAVIQSLVSEWKADDAARARTNSSALMSSTTATSAAATAGAAAAAQAADSDTAAVNAAVSAVAAAAAAAAANSSSGAGASGDVSSSDSPVAAVVTAVESALRVMQGRAKAHAMELEHRDEELSSARALAAAAAARRISFCDFEVGDLALFLPTSHDGDSRVYLAFHMNCPHPYLATESVEQICQAEGRFPDYVSSNAHTTAAYLCMICQLFHQ